MAEKHLRCGCTIHKDSDYLEGCPVLQVERLELMLDELRDAFDAYMDLLADAKLIEVEDVELEEDE